MRKELEEVRKRMEDTEDSMERDVGKGEGG